MARRKICTSFYMRCARIVPTGSGVNMSNRLQFRHRPERKTHLKLRARTRAAADLQGSVQQSGALLHADQPESVARVLRVWSILLGDIEPAAIVGDRQYDLIGLQLEAQLRSCRLGVPA